MRVSNKTEVGKEGNKTDFRPINHYASETTEDVHVVSVEVENHTRFSFGTSVSDLK